MKHKILAFIIFIFILLQNLNNSHAQSWSKALENSDPSFQLLLKESSLKIDSTFKLSAYQNCQNLTLCPKIYQKMIQKNCLNQVISFRTSLKNKTIKKIWSRWAGECSGYEDHPKLNSFLRKKFIESGKLSKDKKGSYTIIWKIEKIKLTIKAFCPKSHKPIHQCNAIELNIQ